MKSSLLLLSLIIFNFTIQAKTFDIQDRMATQSFYLEVYPLLLEENCITDDVIFKDELSKLNQEKKEDAQLLLNALDPHLPPLFLKALVTYRFIKEDSEKLQKVLSYTLFHKLFILRDIIDHPRTKNPKAILNVLRTITEHKSITTENLYGVMSPLIFEKTKLITQMADQKAFRDSLTQTNLLTYPLSNIIPSDRHYLLSHLGIIPGNEAELISENKTDLKRITWFAKKSVLKGTPLDFNAPYIEMPLRPRDDGHPSFKEDPIFIKLKEVIAQAQDSIFIDIFLMGGTLGATLSEYLINTVKEKTLTNPNFKVLILHDFSSHGEINSEVMPIFTYLKEQREKNTLLKKHLFLLQSNSQRHPPGVPFGMSPLYRQHQQKKKSSPYQESRLDHSKILVVDGNSPHAKAYYGSKNWTDHSGGYHYDDVFYIEGPAANLAQASYYRDIQAALTESPEELSNFFLINEGFSNKEYLERKEEILNAFKITIKDVPIKGKISLRIAETGVDAVIRNTRNILIDMISRARINIYMEQLFLYDRYIVDSLIKAKIERPDLDIKVILDHNHSFNMNGLPNTLFIKDLKKYGIEVRSRKTFKLTRNDNKGFYHQENHRKMTSIDGRILLGGTSNINPDSLQGSFREFGAQVFSRKLASEFNRRFIKAWKDPKKTQNMDVENFRATIGSKVLSKKTSNLINKIGATLLRSKKQIEN